MKVVSLKDFNDPEKQAQFLKDLHDGFHEVGGVIVRDHGLSPEQLKKGIELAQKFFGSDEKGSLFDPGCRGLTGYLRLEGDPMNQISESVEMWHMGYGEEAKRRAEDFYPPNRWPAIPGFQKEMADLFSQFEQVTDTILKGLSLSIGEKPELLSDLVSQGWTTLRLAHYTDSQTISQGTTIRGKAHVDISAMTILSGGSAKGLEIKDEHGTFVPIPPDQDDILVVGLGEILRVMTNGYFKSLYHRVVRYPGKSVKRISIPFFVCPPPSQDMTPLPQFVTRSKVAPVHGSESVGSYVGRLLGLGSEQLAQSLSNTMQ